MDHNRVGDQSEMKVAADLSAMGDVSLPVGQPAYDLIVDIDGKLYRIQVKTAQRTGQRNNAHTVHVKHGFHGDTYSIEEFDVLAVTAKSSDDVAYWPWVEESVRETLTVWFDRGSDDFRPCNRGMANIAEEMSFHDAIESLKSM
jgi:hypothetical protein